MALVVKNLPANEGDLRDLGSIPGWEDPLEKVMATHSNILAWRISCIGEPDGLSPWGCKESDTTEAIQHVHKPLKLKHQFQKLFSTKSSD